MAQASAASVAEEGLGLRVVAPAHRHLAGDQRLGGGARVESGGRLAAGAGPGVLGPPDVVEQELLGLADGVEDPRCLGTEQRERAREPVRMEHLGQLDERPLHVVAPGAG
jgi:hypothetical protein